MSENQAQLVEMAERLFAELRGLPFEQAWPRIEEAGFGLMMIPEEDGGFGGDFRDLGAVMRLAGMHALSAPLGEHILARHVLHQAGVEAPDGMLSLAEKHGARVPWGRFAAGVVVEHDEAALLVSGAIEEGSNPAGEPRDGLRYEIDQATPLGPAYPLFDWVAWLRVCQTAGALDAALALAIEHCSQRTQFGRPLSKFQAVQQSIALIACEAAAVNCAAQGAARALDYGGARFEVGAAKLRANRAIGTGTALAHQVHGAIGFTREYPLNELTRRMMGWRSEGGTDAYWSLWLGRHVSMMHSVEMWDQLTLRSDLMNQDLI
ncbi:acyl-CoA dehydrogenase family protein [Parerythrobacter aestuarii]|uniref:acyl-CoA dehydrogenase family protein n=1 Tax=Parerythrobacter aestuarii TaxID=3020909 RepID=UPI0024DE6F75|nr:acyl-CoA dehydrogenase family protein [Parerythrobacter aestuarii]